MACGAVVGLVARCTAVSVDGSFTSMVLVAPTKHVILRTHHFVTLETGIARAAAQVVVAVLAIGVLIHRLFCMIGTELEIVILWQCGCCEVRTWRITVDNALVTHLATSDSHSFRRPLGILVALCALLHLRNTYITHI